MTEKYDISAANLPYWKNNPENSQAIAQAILVRRIGIIDNPTRLSRWILALMGSYCRTAYNA